MGRLGDQLREVGGDSGQRLEGQVLRSRERPRCTEHLESHGGGGLAGVEQGQSGEELTDVGDLTEDRRRCRRRLELHGGRVGQVCVYKENVPDDAGYVRLDGEGADRR